ncbi:MAG: hypothetical protein V4596_07715 [Bdellovibrionota bacterium]
MKVVFLFVFTILAGSVSYANSDQDKSLKVLRAACNASNYWDKHRNLPDTDGSPNNVSWCYARGTELILKGIKGTELVEGACKVVIFSWPKNDGVWKTECVAAGYKELLTQEPVSK